MDVAILGGGPAGALCAAELGEEHDVVLIDRGRERQRLEGLSPRAATLLESKALGHALATLGPPLARRVRWATFGRAMGGEVNGEHLVARPGFDRALREDAGARGARLLRASVRGVSAPRDAAVDVAFDGGRLRARFVVDARGRGANRRAAEDGPRRAPLNLAVAAFVDGLPFASGTEIRALEQGWLWLARARADAPCWAQLLIDGGRGGARDGVCGASTPALDRRALGALLHDALARVAPAGPASRHRPTLASAPLARAAGFRLGPTPRLATRRIAIGDAAAAFDPLSGHGIFWALSSALSAAAIVRTLLAADDPDTRALCERFARERLRETFLRQARIGRDFYRLERAARGGAFWRARSRWPDARAAHAGGERARIARGAAVSGGRVVEMPLLYLPDATGPVAFVGRVPIGECLERFAASGLGADCDAARFHRRCAAAFGRRESDDVYRWLRARALLDAVPAGIGPGPYRARTPARRTMP